ncbi:MAG: SDR family oxidoreductase [Calditrichales bacterium]|nr:MAG: SDR family oxidoreductase [Calditrichales bacterium]
MKSIVVTGVSSGIGYAAAKYLILQGFRVFGSVRNEADARRVQLELGQNLVPLIFDLTRSEQIETAGKTVREALNGEYLIGLVNNAGIAVSGPLMHIPLEEVRRQLEVNVLGVLRTIQVFLPLLGAVKDRQNKPGRIVNISSVSGRMAMPLIGPYTASKHALEGLSDVLRRELFPYGIKVIVIAPGNVRTPIWDKLPDISVYKDTIYYRVLEKVMSRMDRRKNDSLDDTVIAQKIYRVLTMRRPGIRYIMVKDKFKNWTIPRSLPDRWVDRMVEKKLSKYFDPLT